MYRFGAYGYCLGVRRYSRPQYIINEQEYGPERCSGRKHETDKEGFAVPAPQHERRSEPKQGKDKIQWKSEEIYRKTACQELKDKSK